MTREQDKVYIDGIIQTTTKASFWMIWGTDKEKCTGRKEPTTEGSGGREISVERGSCGKEAN